MQTYQGLSENDWKIIQIAVQKLSITGAEAPMVVTLLQKIQMEIEFSKLSEEERPKKGDIITKE